jgi:hypothetical protein
MLALPLWRPGAEVMTGDTQGHPANIFFDWYQPVYHYDEKRYSEEGKNSVDGWVRHMTSGRRCATGSKGSSQVVARTTVKE